MIWKSTVESRFGNRFFNSGGRRGRWARVVQDMPTPPFVSPPCGCRPGIRAEAGAEAGSTKHTPTPSAFLRSDLPRAGDRGGGAKTRSTKRTPPPYASPPFGSPRALRVGAGANASRTKQPPSACRLSPVWFELWRAGGGHK